MEKEDLWVLLGKQLNGEITEEERTLLQQLLQEDEHDLSYLIEFLGNTWGEKQRIKKESNDPRLENRWKILSDRLFSVNEGANKDYVKGSVDSDKRKASLLSFWYKVAAVALVMIGVSVYFIHVKSYQAPIRQHEIIVGNGAKKHIQLPDGTEVWLNADSRLTYAAFGNKNRDVWLEGEAFFKVEKDDAVPFTVKAKSVTIQVLGTAFNVKAYKDDPDIQTTLISGKVQVLFNNDLERKVVLSPHEKLTVISRKAAVKDSFNVSTKQQYKIKSLPGSPEKNKLKYQVQTIPLNPVDSNYFAETAWVHNKMAFVYEPFGAVAKEMERRYNVHIIFKDKSLKKVVMSGVFDKETVGEALKILQMITRFHYHTIGDSIYLYK